MKWFLVPLLIVCLSLELQLVSTQGCVGVAHCKTCEGDNCQECNENYFLDHGGCHECAASRCPQETYFDMTRCAGRDGGCQDCPDGCDHCLSSTECTSCSAGYALQTNRTCATVRESCSPSYCGVGRCIPLESSYTCECGPFAFLALTTGAVGVGHPTCIPCGDELLGIPDCAQCDSNDRCLVCENHFREFDGHCIDVNECAASPLICGSPPMTCHNTDGGYECRCENGFYLHTDSLGTVCKVCPMGCDGCLAGGECPTCHLGYVLTHNNACAKCVEEGCSACDPSSLMCTKCFPGYWKKPFESAYRIGTCQPCSANCMSCREEGGKEMCEECGPSGFFIIGGKCERCSTEHCAKCGPLPSRCVECMQGFEFNSDASLCEPVSPTRETDCALHGCNMFAACVNIDGTSGGVCVCNHGYEGSGNGIQGCHAMKCAPVWVSEEFDNNVLSTFTVKANGTCDVFSFERIIVRLNSTKLGVNTVTFFEHTVGYHDQTAVFALGEDPNDPYFVVRGPGWKHSGQALGVYVGGIAIELSPVSLPQSLSLVDTPDYKHAAFDVTVKCEPGKEEEFASLEQSGRLFELSDHITNALAVGIGSHRIPAEYITINVTAHTMSFRFFPDDSDSDSQQERRWSAYDLMWLFKHDMDIPNHNEYTEHTEQRVSKLRSSDNLSFVFGSIVSVTPKMWCYDKFVNLQECRDSSMETDDNRFWILIAVIGVNIAILTVFQLNKRVSIGRNTGYMPTSAEDRQDFGASGVVGVPETPNGGNLNP